MAHITAAESAVMEALWRRSPLTADEIANEIAKTQDWSVATVKTLINRLLKKKIIDATTEGRRYFYRPLVNRADYVSAESQGLLDRLFAGRLAPLVSHFSQNRQLSAEDITEIRRLLDRIDR